MEHVINIIGEIGVDVKLEDVISQVNQNPNAEKLIININSIGGIVDVGFDIYNYVKSLQKPIKTIGNEIVASISTVIFMAGDERELKPNTEFMIHMPAGGVSGTSEDIENYNEVLKKYDKKIIDFYVKSTGLTAEAITPLLKYETFMSPQMAKSLGFATIVPEDIKVYAKATYNNLKIDTKMNDEQKGMFEKILNKIDGLFSKIKENEPIKAVSLMDENGQEIVFGDVEEGNVPAVGDAGTIDGAPVPDGTYIMPSLDNASVTFAGGVITEITPAEDEMEALLQDLKTKLEEAEISLKAKDTLIKSMKTEMEKIKAEVKAVFDVEPNEPNEPKGGKVDYKEVLNKLKNKR